MSTRLTGSIIAALCALAISGCGTAPPMDRRVYVKSGVDRHDLAIDSLECRKQAVAAHKAALMRTNAADPNASLKARAAARAAIERCARQRGYRRVS